jgi:High potential iron-sulfur protein
MTDAASAQARRRFLKLATAGLVAAPFGGMLAMRRARGQQKVSPEDEMAQQLGYHEDASAVDVGAWPTYEESQNCANCQLFEFAEGEEFGPCQIFGGQLVAAAGWCSAWVEREV